MGSNRLIGKGAGAVKYDVITALSVAGLNAEPRQQISNTRLISLITARYNWQTDTLTIGQREMSLLWGVGERTAKREVKRWLESGILICKRQGVRGRVATYGLNIARLCEETEHVWAQVGPDFRERMHALKPDVAKVIRLEDARTQQLPAVADRGGGWESVMHVLRDRFPNQFDAWIAPLVAREDSGTLVLEARSAFAAEYIKTHFGREIYEAVLAHWSTPIQVVFRSSGMRNRL